MISRLQCIIEVEKRSEGGWFGNVLISRLTQATDFMTLEGIGY